MRFHERSFKLRRMSKNENSSREENPIKLRKIRKRKNKTHFILKEKKKKQKQKEKLARLKPKRAIQAKIRAKNKKNKKNKK